VTLSEVSYLSNQPPNPAITGVGPALVLSFSTPTKLKPAGVRKVAEIANRSLASDTSDVLQAFQFSISTANNNVASLNGSAVMVGFTDASGANTLTGTTGNYDSTVNFVTGSIGSDLLSGFVDSIISSIQFGAMNITNPTGLWPLIPGPVVLGTGIANSPAWNPYSNCPTGKTLVLVHGLLSSVHNAFPGITAKAIQETGEYDGVVGYNYDWTQGISTSGAQLASFLDALAECHSISRLDIEAHSEGVPVSLSALLQTKATITKLVSLGGPIMGTPAANDPRVFITYLAGNICVSVAEGLGLLDLILRRPFINDLRMDSPGQPNSTLAGIRSGVADIPSGPTIVLVAGLAKRLSACGRNFDMSWATSLMGTSNFDGIIPLTSALGFSSKLKVHPLKPFSNSGHQELVSEAPVQQEVGFQVRAADLPALLCNGSDLRCEGEQNSSFIFQGQGFNSAVANVEILRLNSSGVVSTTAQIVPDGGGNLTWMSSQCLIPLGSFSMFAFDSFQHLASNNVTQTVNPGNCVLLPGTITTVAGSGIPGYSGDGGPATSAELSVPTGVAFDGDGNMFIADSNNSVIRRVDAATALITTVVGNGTAGYSGDGGPATNAQLSRPSQLAFDGQANLYIADSNNGRIRKVDSGTMNITTVAGRGTAGYSGDGGPATNAEFNFPNSVISDDAGNLYIADSNNNAIRRVDAASGVITTFAGTGVAGFSGDGGSATSAQLNSPTRPALDAAGNLYIADLNNNRVRKVDLTGVITTVAGNGTAGFSGDGGSATSAQLNGPLSVTVGTTGNLYIADINNGRIRVVNTNPSPITVVGVRIQPGDIETVAGNGFVGYSGDRGPATGAALNGPTGVKLDSVGNLYFTDSRNNVVRKVTGQP
jgi:sugar lactone lactonase YvrE/pimeloyl-ACP methyl ester carboxylesterase